MPLNPNANTFSFNPDAPTFSFGAPEAAAAPPAEAKEEPKADAADPAADAAAAEKAAEEAAAAEAAKQKAAEEAAAAKAAAAAAAAKKAEEEAAAAAAAAKKKAAAEKKAKAEAAAAAAAAKEADMPPAHEFKVHDEREHVNIVFIGHVDSGKSTISGQILLLTGQVDDRTIAKYEREAKEKNRDSWYLAYILDENEEERAKGKTVEVGSAKFATDKKRYTLLDAPGHKAYVPNMISGASQADVAVLIISARKSEFEAGFDRGGQTREHAMLAKTLGVQRLVVAVNKMDEPTVNWGKKRYDQIVSKVGPFLRKTGFKPADVQYVPISGLTGLNLKDPVSAEVCPWLEDRRSLMQVLDALPAMDRDPKGPLRVPITARYKEMGVTHALGKVQSGTLVRDTKLYVEPIGRKVQLVGIDINNEEVDMAAPGENVLLKLKGIDEDEMQEGFVVCGLDRRPQPCVRFNAQLAVMELLEHNPVLTVGYTAILHVHTVAVECQVVKLVKALDKKTGKAKPGAPKFLRNGDVAIARLEVPQSIVVDTFKNIPSIGRFTLRDEGKTIAIGKITRLPQVAE